MAAFSGEDVDGDAVGAGHLLPEEAAQPVAQHTRRGQGLLPIRLVVPGVGEEGERGRAAGLASLAHFRLLDRLRELHPAVFEAGGRFARRGKGAEIAGQERRDGLHVEAADEDEGEIGGVGKALAVEAQALVPFQAGDILRLDGAVQVMAGGVDLDDRVPVDRARVAGAMRDGRLQPVAQDLEALGPVVGRGQLQVHELQRGLQVRGRAGAGDAVGVVLDLR